MLLIGALRIVVGAGETQNSGIFCWFTFQRALLNRLFRPLLAPLRYVIHGGVCGSSCYWFCSLKQSLCIWLLAFRSGIIAIICACIYREMYFYQIHPDA